MMGQQVRSESLFYYFKLDDYLPENHLLRLIDQHISFAFVRERLKDRVLLSDHVRKVLPVIDADCAEVFRGFRGMFDSPTGQVEGI